MAVGQQHMDSTCYHHILLAVCELPVLKCVSQGRFHDANQFSCRSAIGSCLLYTTITCCTLSCFCMSCISTENTLGCNRKEVLSPSYSSDCMILAPSQLLCADLSSISSVSWPQLTSYIELSYFTMRRTLFSPVWDMLMIIARGSLFERLISPLYQWSINLLMISNGNKVARWNMTRKPTMEF